MPGAANTQPCAQGGGPAQKSATAPSRCPGCATKPFSPEGLSCSSFSSVLALAARSSSLDPEASSLASSSDGFCQQTTTRSALGSSGSSREPPPKRPHRNTLTPPPSELPTAAQKPPASARLTPATSAEVPRRAGSWALWVKEAGHAKRRARGRSPAYRGLKPLPGLQKVPGELQSTGPDLQGGPAPQGLRRLLLSESGPLPANGEGRPTQAAS